MYLQPDEIEAHTGLFIQSGYQQYEFAHKSLQEYLTAEYLVKLPSLVTIKPNIELLGAELAIATSISSNPSLYFSEIVLGIFNQGNLAPSFYDAFISRLILERPDFYICEELVLATFSLLHHRSDDNKYIQLMNNIINDDEIILLGNYYIFDNSSFDDMYILRLKKKHQTYNLLDFIRTPKNNKWSHLFDEYSSL